MVGIDHGNKKICACGEELCWFSHCRACGKIICSNCVVSTKDFPFCDTDGSAFYYCKDCWELCKNGGYKRTIDNLLRDIQYVVAAWRSACKKNGGNEKCS